MNAPSAFRCLQGSAAPWLPRAYAAAVRRDPRESDLSETTLTFSLRDDAGNDAARSPMHEYRARVRAGRLRDGDAPQTEALRALQTLRDRLVSDPPGSAKKTSRSFSKDVATTNVVQGVYLHGGVGRGKTMLMDIFHSTLPPNLKAMTRRVHFHEFMHEIHGRLHALRSGGADPLAVVAAAVREESPIVCFDEVEIVDVADAMVVKRLFERVFQLGGVLVATSNAAPEKLYEGGINRAAFAPFVDDLNARCLVVSLDDEKKKGRGVDYRVEGSVSANAASAGKTVTGASESVLAFGDRGGDAAVERAWNEAAALASRGTAPEPTATRVSVPVASGRFLTVPKIKGTCAMFDFESLCGAKSLLGASDYVALCSRFDALAVTNVPTFSTHNENEARRFINLIDVMYERRTLLVASLASSPASLFRGEGDADDAEEEEEESARAETTGDVAAATRRRARREGERSGVNATVNDEGGSSGRSTTMIGSMEWSATGRSGASLADLQRVNFTFRASERCASRLAEMASKAYEAAWVSRVTER